MAKISINSSLSMEEAFDSFLFAKSAQGLTDKTISSYRSHFKCISNYMDTTIQLSDLKKETTFKMIAKMREANLSPNTIASYVRVLKAFLSWAREEGLSDVRISNYKTEETVKETYTDQELALLLTVNKLTFPASLNKAIMSPCFSLPNIFHFPRAPQSVSRSHK